MYSPKIKDELVRELYHLKHSTEGKKIPMTKIVNKAVAEYLNRNKINEDRNEKSNNCTQIPRAADS